MSWQSLLAGIDKPLKAELSQPDILQAMTQAAQEVYNEWSQDDEGIDEELGTGGICDAISQAISGLIAENIENVELTEGGQDGDDHAYVIVYNEDEAYGVDIPPSLYETGGGYSWTKVLDVTFTPQNIDIFEVPHPDDV